MEACKSMWVLFCSCFCVTERFSKVSVVIAISINQTLKLCYCSECLLQALTALSSSVYELLVPLLCRFVCFCFCSETLLAKLLLVTGTQVPPHPTPSPRCPSPAVFLYYKPGLPYMPHLPFLVQAATGRVQVAQERDPRGVVLLGGRGSFEPGLKSGSCPEPREWGPPQPPPVSGGSALCHSAP